MGPLPELAEFVVTLGWMSTLAVNKPGGRRW
jgi:hypothetical protein